MQGKRWCFTINNHDEADITAVRSWDSLYCVFGKEVGDSGTPHLQGFVTFAKNYRIAGVKKLHATAHWEIARGSSKQASDYCKKDGDYEEIGSPPYKGKRTDLETVADEIKNGASLREIADAHPATFVRYSRGIREYSLLLQPSYEHHDVRGFWFYGPPGVGKSRYARQKWPNAYIKQQNKWFDGYDGQDAILIDDFDRGGICLSHHLKIWSDRYPCTGETKGGMIHLNHKALIITSNYTIEELWEDDDLLIKALKRRFKPIHMDTFPSKEKLAIKQDV